jgi:hypothetical protein
MPNQNAARREIETMEKMIQKNKVALDRMHESVELLKKQLGKPNSGKAKAKDADQ